MAIGVSAFHAAAAAGDLQRCRAHVEDGGDVDSPANLRWHDSRTALWMAVEAGQLEVATYLKECGADVECTDHDEGMLMHAAVRSRCRRMMSRVGEWCPDAINHSDDYCASPLSLLYNEYADAEDDSEREAALGAAGLLICALRAHTQEPATEDHEEWLAFVEQAKQTHAGLTTSSE